MYIERRSCRLSTVPRLFNRWSGLRPSDALSSRWFGLRRHALYSIIFFEMTTKKAPKFRGAGPSGRNILVTSECNGHLYIKMSSSFMWTSHNGRVCVGQSHPSVQKRYYMTMVLKLMEIKCMQYIPWIKDLHIIDFRCVNNFTYISWDHFNNTKGIIMLPGDLCSLQNMDTNISHIAHDKNSFYNQKSTKQKPCA